jgi:predicted AlkP superfamily phosphohydrolase/phosphomutase
MPSGQVLAIGLDGADFRYLNQFSDNLPNINELRDEGVEAPLQSTHPPWTGSAWPSMYTGLDPSHHGVYDFFDYRDAYPDEAAIVSRNDVNAPAIWNHLSEVGLESIILNVPITHPAEEIKGVLVPGYLAPSGADGYPSGIRDELSEELGNEYQIYSESETSDNSQKKIDDFEALIRQRADAAEYLLQTREWNFAFVQVQKTDTVFHNSSSQDDFRRIYEAADNLVGRLVDACESTPNVVLLSDHGIGPTTGNKVYINELLHERGFITTKSNPTNLELSEIKKNREQDSESSAKLVQLVDSLKNIGIVPTKAYRIAERIGVEEQILRYLPTSLKQSLAEGVDWQESKAYCRRTSEHGIRINLKGRDTHGVVSPEEYEDVRTEIIQLLSTLEADDGEPVFELVCPREEVYDGPYTEDACDILFRTQDMNHEISTHFHGRTIGSVDSHNHKEMGIFIASGSEINCQWSESMLSLIDIAPVLFCLLRVPIPDRMIGTIPEQLLSVTPETESYGDVAYGREAAYSQDRSEVTDRLEDLGYL